jgi:hypothetical protein
MELDITAMLQAIAIERACASSSPIAVAAS